MMYAAFKGNPNTVISCYSPINAIEETDTITYNELFSLVQYIPKYIIIISGNMNTHYMSIHVSMFHIKTEIINSATRLAKQK